jgi:Holliday junction resolvase-like predicted endonuclease
MPNRNYERGREAEWAVRRDIEQCGYRVIRASASQGFADIVGKHPETGHIVWVQVKRGKTKPTPCEFKAMTGNVYHEGETALVLWYNTAASAKAPIVVWCSADASAWPEWFAQVRWTPPQENSQMRMVLRRDPVRKKGKISTDPSAVDTRQPSSCSIDWD